jgi:hypothetical protein
VSPDDTLPCPASVPPPGGDVEAREERAKATYTVWVNSLKTKEGLEVSAWEDLDEDDREAWRCASDAAYNYVVVSPT